MRINPPYMGEIDRNQSHIYYEDFKHKENSNLRDFLAGEEMQVLVGKAGEQIILVLGGDGTMLSAIRKYQNAGLPFLGINFGNKGFLLNEEDTVKKAKSFVKREYPLLECCLEMHGENHKFYAFNEIDIRSANGRIITLEIVIGGNKSIHIAGDGVIVSTPAGSTGYNSSLGGPIIPHQIEALVITPKAPWKPKGQGPILIPQTEIIQIRDTGRENPLQIYGDGIEILATEKQKISLTIKKAEKKVSFLIAENNIKEWDAKVMQEQGFI